MSKARNARLKSRCTPTGNNTPEETIKSEAAAQAGVTEDKVTVGYIRLCNNTPQADFDSQCTSTQRTSLYLTVRVIDYYRPIFPLFSMGTKQADGTYLVVAKAAIRTQ